MNVGTGDVSVYPALADARVLELVCAQGDAWALTSQGLVALPEGELLYGVPELSTLGEIRGMHLDEQARIWILGDGGVALYPL